MLPDPLADMSFNKAIRATVPKYIIWFLVIVMKTIVCSPFWNKRDQTGITILVINYFVIFHTYQFTVKRTIMSVIQMPKTWYDG